MKGEAVFLFYTSVFMSNKVHTKAEMHEHLISCLLEVLLPLFYVEAPSSGKVMNSIQPKLLLKWKFKKGEHRQFVSCFLPTQYQVMQEYRVSTEILKIPPSFRKICFVAGCVGIMFGRHKTNTFRAPWMLNSKKHLQASMIVAFH